MFSQDAFMFPSSPFSSKTKWESAMDGLFSHEQEIICPRHLLNDHVPRTEDNTVSMLRQISYSPLIKQESDRTYSQADYTYTNSAYRRSTTPIQLPFSSTPKLPSWEFFFDDSSKQSGNAIMTTFITAPEDLENKCPENLTVGTSGVKVVRPAPKRAIEMDTELFPPKKLKRQKRTVFVTLKFGVSRPLLQVVHLSGPEREYRLPVFRSIKPLDLMLDSGQYELKANLSRSNPFEVPLTTGKRYVSRFTRKQLALVLGLHNYDIALVKDIEDIILSMCDQLCGLKIGESSWSRIPRSARIDTVNKVHRFAKPFFPNFTMDDVLTIIKRGAYSRTQEFLRRKRRREKKYCIEQMIPLISN